MRLPVRRLPIVVGEAGAGKPESALMGEMEMMRSLKDVAPEKVTLYVPLLAGRIFKVTTRPKEVPINNEIEE